MPKHLLTGEEFSQAEISALLDLAAALKGSSDLLKGKHLALLFEKRSLRTRFSFTVAMHELGGFCVETIGDKKEDPEDVARVLEGYCHVIMIRTHSDTNLERMSAVSKIPIINGLTSLHHPCQILADLLTLQDHFGKLNGLHLAYVGDGNNILHSLLLLAPKMGIHVHYCCPEKCQPNSDILERAQKNLITSYPTPIQAVEGVHAVYTDVWTSMGFEDKTDESHFEGFQVNELLMKHALPEAIFMHCMPIVKGKEVNTTLPYSDASVIFKQSENRLHIQKAILATLLKENL